MGILSNITGVRSAMNITGAHAIAAEAILSQTDVNAITPASPGDFTNLRSIAIETKPRYIDKAESDTIRAQAKEITSKVNPTVNALRALGRAEKADAKVQKEFRRYQGKVAEGELTKVSSNARLGRKLHGQRASYAALGAGMFAAEQKANNRVVEIQADVARFF